MSPSRIVASLALCLSLSLLACGGQEPVDASGAEALMSVDQGLGYPPSCVVGDHLIYWTENVRACGTCGTSRAPGQLAVQYAACAAEFEATKTLINNRYCITPCELQ